jgi:S-adenosylmethionine hydrolase
MIFLFTDFGAADIYVGQVKAVPAAQAPRVPVVDLLHDVPAFNVKAGAHLLAALARRIPTGAVAMAVVDPGVGGARDPVAIIADGRWFVGPDNGLISVTAARAKKCEYYVIGWRPKEITTSFHGRDLFAPVASMLARGERRAARLRRKEGLAVAFDAADLAEIIYVDHYGNLVTGLRAGTVPQERDLLVNGREVPYARVFSEAPTGQAFWYENSFGLIELAANGASAQQLLGFSAGNRLG